MKKLLPLFMLSLFLMRCGEDDPYNRSLNFLAAYQQANNGKVIVDIPKAYELAHLIMLVEDEQLANSTFTNREIEYYQTVNEWITPFKDHKLFEELDLATDEGLSSDYFSQHLGMTWNSLIFDIEDGVLIDKEIYSRLHSTNNFIEQKELIQDFMDESKAAQFIEDNEDLYVHEINKYLEVVPIRRMWEWLEERFPERYNSYKVILSPLAGATHSTNRFSAPDGSYREILLLVSGVNREIEDVTDFNKSLYERIVFTEIDHNYVNPTTDLFEANLEAAMQNISKWTENTNYITPYRAFNEYMTWGLYFLYLREHYDQSVVDQVIPLVKKQMNESRRFPQFGLFADKLMELYDADPDVMLPDLFTPMIDWIAVNDGE